MGVFLALYQIGVFAGIGYFSSLLKLLENKQTGVLMIFLINFALPSLIFISVYETNVTLYLFILTNFAFLSSFICSIIIYFVATRIFKCNHRTAISMWFLTLLGNTLFIGFPIVEEALGREEALNAIIFDQFASALPLALIAPFLMQVYGSNSKANFKNIFFGLFKNPIFLSFLISLIINLNGIKIDAWILLPLEKMAQSATPIALFVIGANLKFKDLRLNFKPTLVVIFWSMIFSPLFFLGFSYLVNELTTENIMNQTWKMAFLQVATPPMTTSIIVFHIAKLDVKLAVSSIALGTLLCIVIFPIWELLIIK